MMSRRRWLRSALVLGGGALLPRGVGAQQPEAAGVRDTSNLFPMDQSAARSVRLPAKPAALPSMSPQDRDDLEHRIRCQCGCTLAVFTCRTTDFSCQVSPAMHRDIMALVEGGYDAEEILDAFVNVYGDRALMAPPKEGFNLLAYVLPSFAIAVGAIVLGVFIRRMREPRQVSATPAAPPLGASPDELARLNAAIKDDS